ncbi:ribonuclease HII [Roseovarius sp. D22-M7]|uniref:ribonuclease HII n=1 Tax=Roseovarius sp. D22-M7 TaxID=3127116 RepID=UPI00301002BD
MRGPDLLHEARARAAGFLRVAGVDEVGRGPIAGPVTAAAVVLDERRIPPGLDDSKRLGAKRRAALCEALLASAQVSVAQATVAEIDSLNILRAAHLAMERALAGLDPAPEMALIDGILLPRNLALSARTIVRGDAASLSIAAASIVAKTCRDRLMGALAQQFPGYGWAHNMGYPTKHHKAALLDLGVTPHHRRSFRPVHNILYQENY